MEQFKKKSNSAWLISVSILAVIVGYLASVAWITDKSADNRLSQVSDDVRDRLARQSSFESELTKGQSELKSLRTEITKIREENTTLQMLLTTETEGSKNLSTELNERLQEAKLYAGMTVVAGTGITIVLSDSTKSMTNVLDPGAGIIHDTDVLKVVNELWNSGAEAVSVNGNRVGPRTNFRCVGSTILVDSVRIASPVRIQAIGDANTLLGALNLPGGPLDEIRNADLSMVQIRREESLRLNAFAGSLAMKFANIPEDDEE